MDRYSIPYSLLLHKVIIAKSRGEVSLMEHDTIENVSKPIKNLKCFFLISYIFIHQNVPQIVSFHMMVS